MPGATLENMQPGQPPPHACAICGLVLNFRSSAFSTEVVSWLHGSPMDHDPIPVPADQLRTNFRCDFCLEDNAAWRLPVTPYEAAPGHMNAGDWAVCDQCAGLVRGNRWDALVDRAWTALSAHNGQAMDRRVFVALYKQVRDHIAGPLAPA